jgi:hypothetical protein
VEERRANLTPDVVIDANDIAAALARGEDFLPIEPEAEMPTMSPPAEESCRALWQWCREAGPGLDVNSLAESCWGEYGEEQNTAIENALRAGQSRLQITLGVRTFEVRISPNRETGWQVDVGNRKKRRIRRKVLSTPEELEALLRRSPLARTRSVETCVICCLEFAETAVMPTVELPCCNHTLHQVCCQQLADGDQGCPMCRATIDWTSLGFLTR